MNDSAKVVPAPSQPMACARVFLAACYASEDGAQLLYRVRGSNLTRWMSGRGHWHLVEGPSARGRNWQVPATVRDEAWDFFGDAVHVTAGGRPALPWSPTSAKINGVMDALSAICAITEQEWRDGAAEAAAGNPVTENSETEAHGK